MTDDPADRFREVRDSMAAKNVWLREIRRRTDANGRITPEAAAEARLAAGLPQEIEEEETR